MSIAALQKRSFSTHSHSFATRPPTLRAVRPAPKLLSPATAKPKGKSFDEFTMTAEQKNQYVEELQTKGFFTLKMSKETERLLDSMTETTSYDKVSGEALSQYSSIYLRGAASEKVKNFLERLVGKKCDFSAPEVRQWGKKNVSEYWHVDGHAVGVIATLRGEGTRIIPAPYHRETVLDETWAEPALPDLERQFYAEPKTFYVFTGDRQPEKFKRQLIHSSPRHSEGRIIFIARAAPDERA